MAKRHTAGGLSIAMATLMLGACGATGSTGGHPTGSPAATASAPPCAASPSAPPPAREAQALSVIPVQVLTGVPASVGVMDLGSARCVNVGISQRVAVHVRARIPPLPAESHVTPVPLLSTIEVSPAVTSGSTPQAGSYTLTFTALAAGSTAITYLPATCTLPPGVC